MNDNKFGFTLAEVLITLGIIGVVAAITIPTLVKNYQKTVWVNQLKKSVSTLEQGFQKMMADEEIDDLSNSELCKITTSTHNDFYIGSQSYNQILSILKKYFNFVKYYEKPEDCKDFGCTFGLNEKHEYIYKNLYNNHKTTEGDDYPKFYLSDGTLLGLQDESYCNAVSIMIDINGDEKGPNIWGRDVYLLRLSSKGKIIKHPSYDISYCTESTKNSDVSGYSCYSRIIENGWKMDY